MSKGGQATGTHIHVPVSMFIRQGFLADHGPALIRSALNADLARLILGSAYLADLKQNAPVLWAGVPMGTSLIMQERMFTHRADTYRYCVARLAAAPQAELPAPGAPASFHSLLGRYELEMLVLCANEVTESKC